MYYYIVKEHDTKDVVGVYSAERWRPLRVERPLLSWASDDPRPGFCYREAITQAQYETFLVFEIPDIAHLVLSR